MRGKIRKVSLARNLVIDLMHASKDVPLVTVRTTLKLERLVAARAAQANRPGWSTILAKAFSIVARDEPMLRTFYLKWPWPHFYELPKSVAMVAIAHPGIEKDAIVLLKLGSVDESSLIQIEEATNRVKNLPPSETAVLRRILRVAALPLPLRRLAWAFALNIGRQRANAFGTFAITSVASLGVETVFARTPGPTLMSYGLLQANHTMELLFHWDHRIYDGILIARAARRLEEVMNSVIADELLASTPLVARSAGG